MIEITSRCSIIRRGELRRCVELLGPEYTSLPYKVYVYRDREEVQTELDENPDMPADDYDYILKNVSYQPPGVCLHEKKLIKLFPFNLDQSIPAMQKLHSVGNAFHELRHAWQQMNGLYLEEAEQKLDSDHIEDYLRLPSEKDAYAFQEDQMNKHAISISNILGFQNKSFNYTCDIEATIQKIKMAGRR
jgi:hypothetical protein